MPCLLKNARLWPYAVFWWHPRQFCRASGSEKSEKSERSDHEHLCSIGRWVGTWCPQQFNNLSEGDKMWSCESWTGWIIIFAVHLGVNGSYLLVKRFSIDGCLNSSGSGMERQCCEAAMQKFPTMLGTLVVSSRTAVNRTNMTFLTIFWRLWGLLISKQLRNIWDRGSWDKWYWFWDHKC